MRWGLGIAVLASAMSLAPSAAAADEWLPHPAGASWVYRWSDSVYAPTPTQEKVTVKSQSGQAFTLAWTTDGLNNPSSAVTSTGTVSFQDSDAGIVNTNWTSSPPPSNFPILCAQTSNCGNSLASSYYALIWGTRNPVLAEPLLQGISWAGTGGTNNDVSSTSSYLGTQRISVPAFSKPVVAAVVRSQVTQAGAIGDPYGSGIRTVWWVYGVGPVKIVFDHTGGAGAPVTSSMLQSTTLKPLPTPTDLDYFPFVKGTTLTYKWTNSKHLVTPEIDTFSIDAVVNNTARFTIKKATGPIRAKGSYGYSKRVEGVTNLWGNTAFASTVTQPPLGPANAPAKSRDHFASPLDLMNFGLNPILPAYPGAGQTWATSRTGTEFITYGVTGSSRILGIQKVTVPAGTFEAVAVRTTLKQPGFPYGSGTRTCWFAPGKGLVKLVFDHGDHSVSTVVLMH
ncbi:MAG TPA: hypothetical protein VGL76_11715 [Gaiellaceae bacterium]|jgi:hypothetical protein